MTRRRASSLERLDEFAHAHRWVPFERLFCDAFDASLIGEVLNARSRAPRWLIRLLAGV